MCQYPPGFASQDIPVSLQSAYCKSYSAVSVANLRVGYNKTVRDLGTDFVYDRVEAIQSRVDDATPYLNTSGNSF